VREKVRAFVQAECIPAEQQLETREYEDVLWELRDKARAQGLWCPFVPKEHGGMGLRPLANALVQMELGESYLGALALNTQGPDDATMLTLLEHGTDDQKERFLKPLLAGEKRICYSMTEKAAGADATGMQTRAEKTGRGTWILNGEKWFSSAASDANIAVVMAKTDPDAPRHQQFSTFLVDLPNPGYKIVRDIPTMAVHGPLSEVLGGGHSEVLIQDLEVPEANLLGGQGQGFNMGQHRLAYGRLRHRTPNVAMAQHADPFAFFQSANHVGRNRDPANGFNLATCNRLPIGDQRQRFQQRPGIAALAFGPQPRDTRCPFRAHLQAKSTGYLMQFDAALGAILAQPMQRRGQRRLTDAVGIVE